MNNGQPIALYIFANNANCSREVKARFMGLVESLPQVSYIRDRTDTVRIC
jgi:uncharacterized protein (DUF2235 family)